MVWYRPSTWGKPKVKQIGTVFIKPGETFTPPPGAVSYTHLTLPTILLV